MNQKDKKIKKKKLIIGLVFVIILVIFVGTFPMSLNFLINSLFIVDIYLKIILTSWPAAILLLGIFLFFRHRKSIDNLIKHITKLSPLGFETDQGVNEQEKSSKTNKSTEDIIKKII